VNNRRKAAFAPFAWRPQGSPGWIDSWHKYSKPVKYEIKGKNLKKKIEKV